MLTLLTLGLLSAGYVATGASNETENEPGATIPEDAAMATFAGGCFWCTEAAFEQVDGVYEAISGYTGGSEQDPTYGQVSAGTTGHAEAVQVHYDPTQGGK